MMMADANLAIIFNGEIYNYIELREELEKFGYSFKSSSDTEVILATYRHWGEKCVERFIGMWAFVVLDIRRNILFCSRDRFGIKPFYYFERQAFFAFSSEIKSLLALPQIRASLDESKAIEFLVNGNQNFYDKTFFQGICVLPPGQNMIYDLNEQKLLKKTYYILSLNNNWKGISHNEAVNEFTRLVNDLIILHHRSDVPIGSCLSGGLD